MNSDLKEPLADSVEVSGQKMLIEKAVGGSYENIGGRSFWIDGPVAREITRRVENALQPCSARIVSVCESLLNKLAKDGLIIDHSDEKELIKGLLSEHSNAAGSPPVNPKSF